MADTLATQALAPLAAGGLALPGAALFLLRGAVVLFGALALGPQPPGPAAAHPTLKGPVAIVAAAAVRLSMGLARTVTVEGDLNGEAVFEAYRLDGEGVLPLLRAASHLGLNAEAHLGGKEDRIQTQAHPVITPALEGKKSRPAPPCPARGISKLGVSSPSNLEFLSLQMTKVCKAKRKAWGQLSSYIWLGAQT